MRFDIIGYSDKGPRQKNEDAWGYKMSDEGTLTVCVADGVGGNPCGEVASKLCVDNFIAYTPLYELSKVVKRIDLDLKAHALEHSACFKMASTLSGCILTDNHLKGIHVGDTRVCILRGNGIKQLTQDHTEVARFVREGMLSPLQARHYPRKNILEMALGSDNGLHPYQFKFDIFPGDRVLLTSDGVHTIINKALMRDISLSSDNLKGFSKRIIDRLKLSNLKDNITFVAIEVN